MVYCKPCHNQIVKDNKVKNHGSERSFLLKHRYGIDSVDFAWRVLQQDGVCALCKRRKPKHVDHDHKTGEVRGILCFNCNRALGYVRDDPMALYALADYLEFHGAGPKQA